jgi:hypothetical protein
MPYKDKLDKNANNRKKYLYKGDTIRAYSKKWRDNNKDKTKEYYERNRERILNKKKEYYLIRKEQFFHDVFEKLLDKKEGLKGGKRGEERSLYNKEYYRINKARLREVFKSREERNKKNRREYQKKWYEKNKKIINEETKERRQRIKKSDMLAY